MSRLQGRWRNAISLLSILLVAKQLGLAVLVFLMSVMWLRIPDANFFEVFLSFVAGVVILAIAAGGEAAILLRMAGVAITRGKIARAAGVLIVCVAAAMLAYWAVGHIYGSVSMLPSYLNSKLPRSLRYVLTYQRLDTMQDWFCAVLQWLVVGVVLACGFAVMAAVRPGLALLRVLGAIAYWSALLLAVVLGVVGTSSLLQWTPGHGLSLELFSLVMRLGVAVVMDAVLVCLVLAVLASILRDDDDQATDAGTPLESQPRTVAVP